MRHADLDDTTLLRLAKDGSAPAYATLVYRHLPTVAASVKRVKRRHEAAVATFVRAMRQLATAQEPLGPWFADQAEQVTSRRRFRRQRPVDLADQTDSIEATDPLEATAVWRELAPRWPNGRRPAKVPTAVAWIGTVIVTVAVSIAVPWITLGQFEHDEAIPPLRAFPIDAHRDGPAYDPTEVPEREPLPTFDFPVPPEPTDDAPHTDDPPTAPSDEGSEQPTPDDADGDDTTDVPDTDNADNGTAPPSSNAS